MQSLGLCRIWGLGCRVRGHAFSVSDVFILRSCRIKHQVKAPPMSLVRIRGYDDDSKIKMHCASHSR